MKTFDATRRPLAVQLLVAVPVCTLALVRHFRAPNALETTGMSSMPWAAAISEWAAAYPVWNTVCIAACLFFGAVFLTRIMLQYFVIRTRNYVPLTLYIYIAAFVMPSQTLVGALCGLITTLGCLQAARSFRKGYCFDAVFRCSLLFGLLPLLYAPMIIVAVTVPVLLSLLRRRWRELVCAMSGLLLPVSAVGYIYWCRGRSVGNMLWYLWQEAAGYDYSVPLRDIPFSVSAVLFVIAAAVAVSVVVFYKSRMGMRARPYRIMLFFCAMLVLSSAVFFMGGSNAVSFSVLSPAVAAAVSYLVSCGRNHLSVAAYYAVAVCIIVSDIVQLAF